MAENENDDPLEGSGIILTEKRRKLLLEGDLDVEPGTIRRHKQKIRERLVDALIDIHIIANSMDKSDLESVADTIANQEEEFEEPIFRSGLSGLVAIGWMIGGGNKTQIEESVSEGVLLGEMRTVPFDGKIPRISPFTGIGFGEGSAYMDPEELISEYEENPESFGNEESALMEMTIREQQA